MGAASGSEKRLRQLPAVDEVLRSEVGVALLARHPRWAVRGAVRAEIERLRTRLLAGDSVVPALEEARLERRVRALRQPSLRRVINATGVVLHTNLGRAPLASSAIARLATVARGYSNLEFDLEHGARGSRHGHLAALLIELGGAEAACVVNNNAAAVLLGLAALAAGREVVVSRGELVEIGGSFRIPDVMRAAGVRVREVGTTNKTHADDYRRAIGPETALLLKVHRSNFAVVGFTAEVAAADLVAIGREAGLPVMVDLGSGCLVDLARFGLPHEPTVGEVLGAGVDLVTFSGDKLLGGPQAGILCGRAALIAEIGRHPLMRALRPDKLTLAALEATLEAYRDERLDDLPALTMLTTGTEVLARRAAALVAAIGADASVKAEVVKQRSAVGGGALPLFEPESVAVAVTSPQHGAVALERRLREHDPPVVGRIAEDRLLLDVRTIEDTEIDAVAHAVREASSDVVPAVPRSRC